MSQAGSFDAAWCVPGMFARWTGCGTGHRDSAAATPGTGPSGGRTSGPRAGQQVLRSSSPVSTGTDLPESRHGVDLPRQTLARWVELAASGWGPSTIKSGPVFWPGIPSGGRNSHRVSGSWEGRTAQGIYGPAPSRGRRALSLGDQPCRRLLGEVLPADFTGTLQCDGYAAYATFARKHPHPVTLAACWAHARAEVPRSEEESPKISGWFLRQIPVALSGGVLASGPERRTKTAATVRAAHNRMIVKRIWRSLERIQSRPLPVLLSQAVAYALGLRHGLEVFFLNDGRVEIGNNTVENAIRPTAVESGTGCSWVTPEPDSAAR